MADLDKTVSASVNGTAAAAKKENSQSVAERKKGIVEACKEDLKKEITFSERRSDHLLLNYSYCVVSSCSIVLGSSFLFLSAVIPDSDTNFILMIVGFALYVPLIFVIYRCGRPARAQKFIHEKVREGNTRKKNLKVVEGLMNETEAAPTGNIYDSMQLPVRGTVEVRGYPKKAKFDCDTLRDVAEVVQEDYGMPIEMQVFKIGDRTLHNIEGHLRGFYEFEDGIALRVFSKGKFLANLTSPEKPGLARGRPVLDYLEDGFGVQSWDEVTYKKPLSAIRGSTRYSSFLTNTITQDPQTNEDI